MYLQQVLVRGSYKTNTHTHTYTHLGERKHFKVFTSFFFYCFWFSSSFCYFIGLFFILFSCVVFYLPFSFAIAFVVVVVLFLLQYLFDGCLILSE